MLFITAYAKCREARLWGNQSRLGRRNPSAVFYMGIFKLEINIPNYLLRCQLYCIRYTKFGEDRMKNQE